MSTKVRKVGQYQWEVESQTNPGIWHKVYYRSCGGRCDCRSFKFRCDCRHLKTVRREVEQLGDINLVKYLTFEEELLYEC